MAFLTVKPFIKVGFGITIAIYAAIRTGMMTIHIL